MKNYFIFFPVIILLLCINTSFASNYDTTFKAKLFEDKIVTVKAAFGYDEEDKYSNGIFKLTVEGLSILDSTELPLDYFEVRVIDVDKKDDFREVAVYSNVMDNIEMQIYRYDGKKLFSLGRVYSMDEPVLKGDGKAKATGWMGFWKYDFEFVFNKNKLTFEPVYKDEYPVVFYEGYDGEIVVKESFKTYKERDIKSEVVTKFKEGDKIKILKAYTKVKCDEGYKDYCFWYLIEDKHGNKGWLQMKDFVEKVEGIPWAG
jgi:hypothetical protein